jgi:hypothetical protein
MIDTGSSISVRTNEAIDVRRSDGRVFSGAVDQDQDVMSADDSLAIPKRVVGGIDREEYFESESGNRPRIGNREWSESAR